MTEQHIPTLREELINAIRAQITHFTPPPRFSDYNPAQRLQQFTSRQRLETLEKMLIEYPTIILHRPD